MAETYNHTISGLLRKRAELMGKARALKEEVSSIGHDVEAIDRVLLTLGYEGDLESVRAKANRVVRFHRNDLRRFLMSEIRKADRPLTTRDLAVALIAQEGKDPNDRILRNDTVKRIGQSLKHLRMKGVLTGDWSEGGAFMWRIASSAKSLIDTPAASWVEDR